ncbi:Tn7 transposition protein A [Brevibacillus panacihumi W25]|uniref:Tn7 transposition protein A n=1 Tax=Brevibacillus panacihumi W25 TaxID=1408254 RepID=V6LZL7_9BACL|nr:heteromeric transposase endonuclease subunit TnsA [Brevibacillus panacihumi]EST51582.1 Tn7 transposition protein A [Brevibacillus panacihumi W25]
MSKRKCSTTASVIERRIREGRGKGNFADYKPWLTIHDVPSKGVVTRIFGWKSGRLHHYLSENYELSHHYQLEWAQGVIDIREQYPLLPLEKTLFIANKLGVRHPIDPKTKHPIVMTVDMLLTVNGADGHEYLAHSIKPISNLNKRVLEKLEIERQYFKDIGIKWSLITENQINYDLAKNVEWLHSSRNLEGLDHNIPPIIGKIAQSLLEAIQKKDKPLAKTTQELDKKLGLAPGTCIQIVKYLIANRIWLVDMTIRIRPTMDPLDVELNRFYKVGETLL